MATLLSPTPTPHRSRLLPAAGTWAPAAAGALAALRAAALTLLPVTLLVVLGWVSAPRSAAGAGSALRWAGDLWLLAHHAPLQVPGGAVGLTPLGLVLLPVLALRSAGSRAAASCAARGRTACLVLTGVLAVVYGGLAAAVALAAATAQVAVPPLLAAGCAGGLALLAGGSGAWTGSGALPPLRLRPGTRALLAAAATGTAALLAAGGLLATAGVVAGAGRIAEISASLDPGPVGRLLLVLVGMLLAPNAAVWGAAMAVGPGFAVGEASSVTVVLTDLPSLPALPILGALPLTGPAPPALASACLAPVLAGVLGALVLRRRRAALGARRTGALGHAAHAGLAGVGAGVLLGVLAALSGGPVGGGRLSAVGPSPWQVALLAGLELAAVGALTAYVAARRRPDPPSPDR